jgi:hypothetical protein
MVDEGQAEEPEEAPMPSRPGGRQGTIGALMVWIVALASLLLAVLGCTVVIAWQLGNNEHPFLALLVVACGVSLAVVLLAVIAILGLIDFGIGLSERTSREGTHHRRAQEYRTPRGAAQDETCQSGVAHPGGQNGYPGGERSAAQGQGQVGGRDAAGLDPLIVKIIVIVLIVVGIVLLFSVVGIPFIPILIAVFAWLLGAKPADTPDEQSTKRPLNSCTCGYTWYPRGSDYSARCPNCGRAR